MEKITSRENRRLVRARKVRDGRERGSIFIEGKRLFEEAVKNEIIIDEIFLSESFARSHPELTGPHPAVFLVPDALLNSVADTTTPQGIIAVARRPGGELLLDEIFQSREGLSLWIMLEAVQDPSNIGAVMRVARAAGAAGLVLSENTVDPYSPRSLRASMGAAFGLSIIDSVPVEKILAFATEKQVRLAAACVDRGQPHWDIDWRVPTLLMFGSEGSGLSDICVENADVRVAIPMSADVESLNVAVSCGVVVYEAVRQNYY
jgi:TrmH family RNA methyltransferase